MNELQIPYTAGRTVYAVVYSHAQAWNGTAFETLVSAHQPTYAIACTEQGSGNGVYAGSMPAIPAGTYSIMFYDQAGGSPAFSDDVAGVGSIEWDGAIEVSLASRAPAATALSAATWTDSKAANLDAPVSGVAPGVWTQTNRTLTDFEFTVHAQLASYATGLDPATLLLVNPANKLLTITGGYIQLDMTQAVPFRNQDGNGTPNVGDALQGAWSEAYAAEQETGTGYIKRMPNGTNPARTFVLTLDANSNPIGRS
ncbi:MAG: hypothetical protein P4L84_35005 [Isosphaeraceae bacterium]|nr:hypothetical protein [Isosphaeraceae bacterium]